MKLRNKRTGEIISFQPFQFYRRDNCKYPSDIFGSLSALNREWEDYVEEPLIPYEKVRKAVRTWAEALGADTIMFVRFSQGFSFGDGNVCSSISFDGFVFDLIDGKKYAVDELCGEKAPEPLEPSFIDLDERAKEKAATEKLGYFELRNVAELKKELEDKK